MKYLTPSQYRKAYGESRQSIHNKMKRGTLITAWRNRKTKVIAVEDTEYEKIKHKLVDEVND